ncbi:MAG: hypothetical protein ACFFBI_06430 [Promethearchaeota archaeon]
MPEEAINSDQKYRIIIYHGHLHKIPIEDNLEKDQGQNGDNSKESIN